MPRGFSDSLLLVVPQASAIRDSEDTDSPDARPCSLLGQPMNENRQALQRGLIGTRFCHVGIFGGETHIKGVKKK